MHGGKADRHRRESSRTEATAQHLMDTMRPGGLHLRCCFCEGNQLEAGSGGRIRTYDQRINSPLRYRCATPEYQTEAGL